MPSGNFAKNIKGAAGVHLVVAELSLGGFVALPTTRNLRSVDVVAFNEKLSRFAFIQVKSTDKPRGGWPVHTIRNQDRWEQDIREALSLGEQFFYVFVSLPNAAQPGPAYYVVPSAELAQMIIDDIRRWLAAKPDVKIERHLIAWQFGGPQPDVVEKYQNKWELLRLGG